MEIEFEEEEDLMEDLQVTLEIDGKEIETKPVTIFEMDEQDYILLTPVDENGEMFEEPELYLFGYEEDASGEPSIFDIEDPEEYQAATARAEEILSEVPEV